MFMKHYAPNGCEPSIEALKGGGGGGCIRADVNGDVGFVKIQKKKIRGEGGGGRVGGGGGGG